MRITKMGKEIETFIHASSCAYCMYMCPAITQHGYAWSPRICETMKVTFKGLASDSTQVCTSEN